MVCYDWSTQNVGFNKKKRILTITDETKECVGVTLWGANCDKFTGEIGDCIALHNGVVGEFNGDKLINCSFNSSFIVEPDFECVCALKKWYQNAIKNKNEK